MGGIAKSVGNAISKVTDSTPFKVMFPVQAAAQALTKAGTGALGINGGRGLSSGEQYEVGAAGGSAIAGAGAMGLFGAPAAAAGAAGSTVGPLTAGVGGVTSGSGLSAVAASGGVPLLTKILLGGSVASTLASFFGKKPGDEYDSWLKQMSAEDQAQVQQLTDNLTTLQGDLNARNQAVSQIVDNYPHIVDQALSDINSSGLSKSMDDMDRISLDRASNQLAAKYAATGGFSSGAFNEGLAKSATDLALSRGQGKIDMANQVALQKLTEANSLRSFAQKMLGLGVDQRFTATRDALDRSAKGGLAAADASAAGDRQDSSNLASIGGNLANLGVNIWGYDKLSSAMSPGRAMAAVPRAAPGMPSIPGGGSPLPDFSDMG